jgi:hypothetical protein
MMWSDADARFDLDGAVDIAINSFTEEFRQFWNLDSARPPAGLEWEEWYELLALDTAAQQIVAAAVQLYRPEALHRRDINLPTQLAAAAQSESFEHAELVERVRNLVGEHENWPEMEQFVRDHLPDPAGFKQRFFVRAVEIALAGNDTVVPNIHQFAQRLLTLSKHLTRHQDTKTRTYLSRVARCYLMGMLPELCIMARAVLEVVLSNRLPPDYMRRVRGLEPIRRVPLSMLINEAAVHGLLTPEAESAANELAELGGKVAHGAMPNNVDADGVLENLSLAVSAVETWT